ncbi:SMI1/KNR4 family protein [Patescibacteria group bacterium]|nr:SMI1/KNR4 family protein [Patescibacteria group bacterium]
MNGDAEHLVNRFEMFLDAKFPQSYRQFLLERGSAVIDGFQILGLPKREEETKEEEPDFERIKEDLSCPLCGKQKQAGRFVCYPCYNVFAEEARRVASKGNRLSLPLWVKERIAQKQKKEKKQEKKEYSALEATEILREERPDLSEKLVAICFNKGRVLCLETREMPERYTE